MHILWQQLQWMTGIQTLLEFETWISPHAMNDCNMFVVTIVHREHLDYMERTIHTMFNPRHYTRKEEGAHLVTLAVYKLGIKGLKRQIEVLTDQFR